MMFVCFLMVEGMGLMDGPFMFLHSGNLLILQPVLFNFSQRHRCGRSLYAGSFARRVRIWSCFHGEIHDPYPHVSVYEMKAVRTDFVRFSSVYDAVT